jgi:hypothetical protein
MHLRAWRLLLIFVTLCSIAFVFVQRAHCNRDDTSPEERMRSLNSWVDRCPIWRTSRHSLTTLACSERPPRGRLTSLQCRRILHRT